GVRGAVGRRPRAARPERPGLPELFRQVGGALFTCLERHESFWIGQEGSRPLETRGTLAVVGGPADPPDVAPLAAAFAAGVRDLARVLPRILARGSRAG